MQTLMERIEKRKKLQRKELADFRETLGSTIECQAYWRWQKSQHYPTDKRNEFSANALSSG